MRVTALIRRIIREMVRDKRTLALLFIAPLLILSLMYIIFTTESTDINLGVVNVNEQIIEQEEGNFSIQEFEKTEGLKDLVIKEDLDGLLQMDGTNFTLILHNDDPLTARSLYAKVNQILASSTQQQAMGQMNNMELPQLNMETVYIFGDEDTEFFDVLSPILIGFFVFFFVFLISGIGFLKERTSGTLDKMMSTPIRRWEILTAYLTGYGIFAVLQTVFVVIYGITVLDIVLVGSIWDVLLINVLLALVALSLGTLLSAFAESEFQMVQFIPVVIIPQIFFSGIIPFDGMAEWVQVLAKFFPMYYGGDALKEVMYKGNGLSDIQGDLLILLAFAFIFITLNLFALKKYRKL
ncbi:ABC transporter permease [Fervidibacillus halotolerans]|uniref:ABC transporter permease n=1 Tax=Fervidibacillus halotolerans TaxID=2980027 RepID=A0A9E8M0B4_9BACI|nr:ABC transporter permease [Fervidibacillus halotolerans]WAA13123.1 ABC transporter permease [Fervidibacillus halotolerans]